MNEAEKQNPTPALDEAEVAAYLQAHPDLLSRYPAVLEALDVPHDSGNAVSLIERQVAGMRNTNRQLQARFNEHTFVSEESLYQAEAVPFGELASAGFMKSCSVRST